MKNFLNITLPGQPTAKQRSRKGWQGHWYNPNADDMMKTKRVISEQLPDGFRTIDSKIPVIVNVTFFFKPSKGESTKKFIKEVEHDLVPHLKKPDRDNSDKYILDCLSKIVLHDDNQIYGGTIFKYYSNNPRTEIEIRW